MPASNTYVYSTSFWTENLTRHLATGDAVAAIGADPTLVQNRGNHEQYDYCAATCRVRA